MSRRRSRRGTDDRASTARRKGPPGITAFANLNNAIAITQELQAYVLREIAAEGLPIAVGLCELCEGAGVVIVGGRTVRCECRALICSRDEARLAAQHRLDRRLVELGAAPPPPDPAPLQPPVASAPRGCESLSASELTSLRGTALTWADKLEQCGNEVFVYGCKTDVCKGKGKKRMTCSCCNLECCPRRQRRYAQGWVERITCFSTALERYGVGLNPDAEIAPVPKSLRWRHFVVSPRARGTIFDEVNAMVKLRADLMDYLTRDYGMIAAFGAIEREGTGHVHAVALCEYVDYRVLEHWLRKRDCTVRKCHHPANDRCGVCTRNNRGDCQHPELLPDGRLRPRCNGSWYVHVSECYERGPDGRRIKSGKSLAGAAREAIKYVTKPTAHGRSLHALADVPEDVWRVELADEVAHARESMLFHLALAGRHRVETYGLARERAPQEAAAIDDAEPNGTAPMCPDCGLPMHFLMHGARLGTMYDWQRACPQVPGPAG